MGDILDIQYSLRVVDVVLEGCSPSKQLQLQCNVGYANI